MAISSPEATVFKSVLHSGKLFTHVHNLSPQFGEVIGLVENGWDKARVIEYLVQLVVIW